MKSVFLSISLLGVVMSLHSQAGETAQRFVVQGKGNHAAKEWTDYETTLLEHLSDFKPASVKRSIYGGRADRKERSTGFFYTRKNEDGWMFVDPEGCPYLSIGVCSTSPHDEVADHSPSFAKNFASKTDWAQKTHAQLVDRLEFNSLGCWSDAQVFRQAKTEVPYVLTWNLLASYAKKQKMTYKKYGHTGFQDDVLPVFESGFAQHCDDVCQKMAQTKDDPWLIGHFSDNELPFASKDVLKRFLKTSSKGESYAAAARFLEKKGIKEDAIKSEQDAEFMALVLKAYYKTVHDAMRKHDPNHLILGSRLHGRASSQKICYEVSGPYVDVVSINYYHRWTPRQEELNERARWAKKPILITEWYAKGADSGLNNVKGAGFTVPTQKDRGHFYENFTLGLLQNNNVIGWHWFRYIDDGDLKTKGLSSNKGIVNVEYQEYRELAESMKAINSQAYSLSDYFRKTHGSGAKKESDKK